MHGKRVLVTLVFLPVFYLVVSYPSPVPFFVALVFASAIGQVEFYRMCEAGGIRPLRITGIVAGAALLLFFLQGTAESAVVPLLTAAFLVMAVLRLFSDKETKGALTDVAVTLAGIIYVAWLLGHLVLLRGMDVKGYFIFFLFLATWAGDTGAYYAGSLLGKNKLYEKISPKKTWEGAVGGLAFSIIAAVFAGYWFMPGFSAAQCVVLGCLLGVSGQIGDLVESLFKRGLAVKDSGALIPGHGGILDRVDSLLFSGPVFYYYLKYL